MISKAIPSPQLDLGSLVATPGAMQAMQESGQPMIEFLLFRHLQGDWGDVSQSDWQANNEAVINGERVLSAYTLADGETRIWVITEADRSSTCILLPSEY